MSTAASVPQTYNLEGDDALKTLKRTGWGRLAKDSFLRFRYADGFSHARALAFQITLTLLPGVIAVVGLATALHQTHFRDILRTTFTRLAPGPASQVILTAFRHGERAAGLGNLIAILFGLLVALISGATAMGQIERGANRIYGIERDRPSLQKYTKAALLTVTAGLLTVVAFVLLIAGQDIAKASGFSNTGQVVWKAVVWPLSIVLVVAAMALLFRESPKRRQPSASWLAVGSAVSVVLWLIFTLLLVLYLSKSSTFSQTYGPLAGMLGVLAWAFLTSLAVFLGLAFAAQLEAVRAGKPGPIREPARPGPDPRPARRGGAGAAVTGALRGGGRPWRPSAGPR
jgi:YihY family inner membrane protein